MASAGLGAIRCGVVVGRVGRLRTANPTTFAVGGVAAPMGRSGSVGVARHLPCLVAFAAQLLPLRAMAAYPPQSAPIAAQTVRHFRIGGRTWRWRDF